MSRCGDARQSRGATRRVSVSCHTRFTARVSNCLRLSSRTSQVASVHAGRYASASISSPVDRNACVPSNQTSYPFDTLTAGTSTHRMPHQRTGQPPRWYAGLPRCRRGRQTPSEPGSFLVGSPTNQFHCMPERTLECQESCQYVGLPPSQVHCSLPREARRAGASESRDWPADRSAGRFPHRRASRSVRTSAHQQVESLACWCTGLFGYRRHRGTARWTGSVMPGMPVGKAAGLVAHKGAGQKVSPLRSWTASPAAGWSPRSRGGRPSRQAMGSRGGLRAGGGVGLLG